MTESRKSRLTSGLFSSTTDLWETPQDLFDELNAEFHFTLDPCATQENAKCDWYYSIEQDGLKQDWGGQRVFCNPPYGRLIGAWVRKCYEESLKPNTKVVMLIPARTDTSYFHDYIYHHADLRFIRGRLKFGDAKQGAPFPSMIVIFRGK
jgi:site-specific DNA-methyltransferase (adenine-specific)